MPSLFDPIRLGAIQAPNRILMAPLTRARSTHDHVPTPLMIEYYRQRASAGLIISEGTGINRQGLGWPFAPGIWTAEQVEGWKSVTAAVHDAGGRIFCQLWHMGRVVHPSFLAGGKSVSASATTAPGEAHTYAGKQSHAEARALGADEIPGLLDDYGRAARHALEAGFDGVELHAANGYLIDQFLRATANHRTDRYGGSIENRIRLLVEVTEALAGAVGADRTAVRLSPNGDSQGVNDPDPEPLFRAAATELSRIGIAFLELREPGPEGTRGKRTDHRSIRSSERRSRARSCSTRTMTARRAKRRSIGARPTPSRLGATSWPIPTYRCASGRGCRYVPMTSPHGIRRDRKATSTIRPPPKRASTAM